MGLYVIRRLLLAIPTLLVISLVVFAILDLAPGDPTSQLPLTIPAEIREQIRESLGFNDPFFVRWWNWNQLMVINEPIHAFEEITGTCIGDCESRERIISWSSRSPAMDTVYERLPQTLWVLGLGLVLRRADRRADRHDAGLQAVLVVRQSSAPWSRCSATRSRSS